jgi:hypothetical protein
LNLDDPTDTELDSDRDGLNNVSEYRAATNPQDATSCLRLHIVPAGATGAWLWFNAVSNKAYTVQFTESLDRLFWQDYWNVPSSESNQVESLTAPYPGSNSFYRLVTPATP